MSEPLVIENVVSGYDQADVLTGVSLTVPEGQITCLLGSNGAGKTTLIRAILGLTPARSGRIRFGDLEADGLTDLVIYDPRRPGRPIRIAHNRGVLPKSLD